MQINVNKARMDRHFVDWCWVGTIGAIVALTSPLAAFPINETERCSMFAQLASMIRQGCCRKQRAVLRVKLVIKLLHQEYTSIDGKPYRHTAVFKQSGHNIAFFLLLPSNETAVFL